MVDSILDLNGNHLDPIAYSDLSIVDIVLVTFYVNIGVEKI